MKKNFHNGTNIIAKHNTNFVGEEILEFFMAPTVKHTLVSWRRKFQPFTLEGKLWLLETCLNSASKNTSKTDFFFLMEQYLC